MKPDKKNECDTEKKYGAYLEGRITCPVCGEQWAQHICPAYGVKKGEDSKAQCTLTYEYDRRVDSDIYCSIVEWLYANDGKFGSNTEWRKAFLKFLKEVIFL